MAIAMRAYARAAGALTTAAKPSRSSLVADRPLAAATPRGRIVRMNAAEIRKDAASRKKAGRAPTARTASPPRAGPTVWRRWWVVSMTVRAGTSWSPGATRGSSAERAGENTVAATDATKVMT